MKLPEPKKYKSLSGKERRALRNEYVIAQKGLCMYCKCPLDKNPPKHIMKKKIFWKAFPPNFLKHPIHLQHNHDTGLTEGAVHARCNAVMWQYKNR